MKIGYLSPDPGVPLDGTKGASAHVRAFVHALQSNGHEVWVASSAPGQDHALNAPVIPIPLPQSADGLGTRAQKGDAKRIHRALRHLWNNVGVEQALVRTVAARGADLIYERYSPFGVAGSLVAEWMGVPHILEVNAPLAWEGERYRKQALGDTSRLLERAAFDAAGMVVAVSQELKDILVEDGVDPSKVHVVPNGVDVDMFSAKRPMDLASERERVVIGFVGGLKPWHGIDLLVEAFQHLAHDSRYELLVVGDGPQRDLLAPLLDRYGDRVRWTGAVPHEEIPMLLSGVDIAVAPYANLERFYFSPLKVLEYLAAGCPVVGSRIGQVASLVKPGETGILVAPGDALGLAQAIDELGRSTSLRREMSEAAVRSARKNHSWTSRIGTILDLARRSGVLPAPVETAAGSGGEASG